MSIESNLKRVKGNIGNALAKTSFNHEVKLVAVTKKIEISKILAAYNEGQRIFGENYVQEALQKMQLIDREDIEWHFIGALQSNKAKYCAGKFSMIQTVDREKLAVELSRQALRNDIRDFPVLIEANLASERTKAGIGLENISEFITKISSYEGIKVKGLMAIPPYFSDPEDSRPYFRKFREIFEIIKKKNIPNIDMKELSIGMSNDYTIAVEEGATIVRVGTAIFGPRNQNNHF